MTCKFLKSYCLFLQPLCSCSVWILSYSACLFKNPLLKNPVCSDWSAVTGLSRRAGLCSLQSLWLSWRQVTLGAFLQRLSIWYFHIICIESTLPYNQERQEISIFIRQLIMKVTNFISLESSTHLTVWLLASLLSIIWWPNEMTNSDFL